MYLTKLQYAQIVKMRLARAHGSQRSAVVSAHTAASGCASAVTLYTLSENLVAISDL